MNDIREDLKAFVDGELSPERMAEVQAVVESDPALSKEVEFMRMLGLEIKRLAVEPAVMGKEAAVEKFKRRALPWWNPATLSGRFAYAGVLFVVLLGMGTVLFPVFAQSKAAAKRGAAFARELSRTEMERLDDQTVTGEAAKADSEHGADATGAAPASPGATEHRYGRFGKSTGDASLYEEPQSPSHLPAPSFQPQDGVAGSGADAMKPESETPPATPGTPPGRGYVMNGGIGTIPPLSIRPSMPLKSNSAQTNKRRPKAAVQKDTAIQKTIPEAPPQTQRMVIKNADISLKVKSAEKALTDAENLAKSLNGYTENDNLSLGPDQTPRATVTLRVPARTYETAMEALRGMGEFISQTSGADDVTAQHADVVGRLGVLRAEADSYVTMLRGAKKIGELMEIKDRLSQVRQEIASLEAQGKALQNESALSTIRATFVEKAKVDEDKKPKEGGWNETWANAVNGLSKVGEFLGNAAIFIFVFSPIWLPPVLLFWWLGRRARG